MKYSATKLRVSKFVPKSVYKAFSIKCTILTPYTDLKVQKCWILICTHQRGRFTVLSRHCSACNFGYIDVNDECWGRNLLAKTKICWRQFWSFSSLTSCVFLHNRRVPKDVTNILAPTPKIITNIKSPTSPCQQNICSRYFHSPPQCQINGLRQVHLRYRWHSYTLKLLLGAIYMTGSVCIEVVFKYGE